MAPALLLFTWFVLVLTHTFQCQEKANCFLFPDPLVSTWSLATFTLREDCETVRQQMSYHAGTTVIKSEIQPAVPYLKTLTFVCQERG